MSTRMVRTLIRDGRSRWHWNHEAQHRSERVRRGAYEETIDTGEVLEAEHFCGPRWQKVSSPSDDHLVGEDLMRPTTDTDK